MQDEVEHGYNYEEDDQAMEDQDLVNDEEIKSESEGEGENLEDNLEE